MLAQKCVRMHVAALGQVVMLTLAIRPLHPLRQAELAFYLHRAHGVASGCMDCGVPLFAFSSIAYESRKRSALHLLACIEGGHATAFS